MNNLARLIMLAALLSFCTPLAARARCYADLYHLRRCTRGWTQSAPWLREESA